MFVWGGALYTLYKDYIRDYIIILYIFFLYKKMLYGL
jgi:hypothetical protein